MLSFKIMELIQQLLQDLEAWMPQFAVQYGYVGVFLISILGSASVVFPIPYTLVIYLIAFQAPFLNPFLIAIAGGFGAAIGEFSGYILGYYGRRIIDDKRRKKMEYMLKIFNRYGTITVFLFALTPLPDDLLFIPLGIMRYSFLKAFIPNFAGKMLMTLVLAYGGRFSNEIIKDMFVGGGMWSVLVTILLFVAIMIILLRVDWEEMFVKYIEKKDPKNL